MTKPVLDHVHRLRRDRPDDIVSVFRPNTSSITGRSKFCNQNALRIKARLRFEPGVIVINVPWQLHSTRAHPEPTGSQKDRPNRNTKNAP